MRRRWRSSGERVAESGQAIVNRSPMSTGKNFRCSITAARRRYDPSGSSLNARDVFEVLIVTAYKGHSPLASRRRNPQVRCPRRPPCLQALSRNISPVPAVASSGKGLCKVLRSSSGVLAVRHPTVPHGPKRQFGQRDDDHQMIAYRYAVRFS